TSPVSICVYAPGVRRFIGGLGINRIARPDFPMVVLKVSVAVGAANGEPTIYGPVGDFHSRRSPVACRNSIVSLGRQPVNLGCPEPDVGAILIEEGLAVPFVCNATRCPPTPRPWCP